MTDRELLEMAARAIGGRYMPHVRGILINGSVLRWSPLQYDGDALRLAVKLGITAIQDKVHRVCAAYWTDCMCCNEPYLDDEFAATRRAITRAAAQIQLDKEKK